MSKIYYTKTVYSVWLIVIILLFMLGIGISYYFQWGSKPIPATVTGILEVFFLLVVLLMYKLNTTINSDEIRVTFGIGLIKKSMLLTEIDIDKLKKMVIPWYYGIGIRITPHGMLYNVKPGDALLIHSKKVTKTLLFGTDDASKIIKTIGLILKK